MDLSIPELRSQIELSNKLISQASKEIENLQTQAKFPGLRNKYKFYKNIMIDNHKLKKSHQNNLADIKEYLTQLNELQKKLNTNKNIIL